MYTLSSKLKLTAIILVIVGAIGLVYGFISTPSNEEELKELRKTCKEHTRFKRLNIHEKIFCVVKT